MDILESPRQPSKCGILKRGERVKILAVTGGRDYTDSHEVDRVMSIIKTKANHPFVVLHGNCKTGVDHLVDLWCAKNGIHTLKCDALWDFFGKSAGPKRNTVMSNLDISMLVGFPGGTGTHDMIGKCEKKLPFRWSHTIN